MNELKYSTRSNPVYNEGLVDGLLIGVVVTLILVVLSMA